MSAPTSSWYAGDFVPDAVYPYTTKDRLPPRALTIGSWLESGKRPGSFKRFGFQLILGMYASLSLVIRTHRVVGCAPTSGMSRGSVTSVEFDLTNPAESGPHGIC